MHVSNSKFFVPGLILFYAHIANHKFYSNMQEYRKYYSQSDLLVIFIFVYPNHIKYYLGIASFLSLISKRLA